MVLLNKVDFGRLSLHENVVDLIGSRIKIKYT